MRKDRTSKRVMKPMAAVATMVICVSLAGVTAEFVNPDIAPYFTFENFGIEDYEIIDADGNVVVEDEKTELVEIVEGKIIFEIPVSGLGAGNYKLVVNRFVGSAKADQPLVLSGTWECEFER